MCQAANRINKKLLKLTIQRMRRQWPHFKLDAKKGKKRRSFPILPCYWNHSEERWSGAERRRGRLKVSGY
jgi:hypothetical protein